MTEENERLEAWFAGTGANLPALQALRAILREAGLAEAFKWRGPCYTLDGGNVALLWSFKDCAALGFFKGTLLADPEGLLEAPGEQSRAMRKLSFASAAAVAATTPAIRAFVAEAIALERAGEKVDFAKDDLAPPQELTDALDADPALAAAWTALTPGRRRSWLLHLSQAKQAATRLARIGKARAAILAGKGMSER